MTAAHFWRWIIGLLLVFGIARYAAELCFLALNPHLQFFSFVGFAVLSVLPLAYVLTFFLNLFFLQGFDRLAGERIWTRVLTGVGVLVLADLAMQPVLARRTAAMTSTWQFLLRFSLIVVALAAVAIALYPAPLRLK